MKRNKILLLLLAAFTLTSCLDENAKDQIPESEAFSTPSNLYINAVATLYNYIGGSSESQGLQGTYRGVYDYNTFTTDEAMLPTRGGDWYDGGFWQSLYLHTWTASDQSIQNTWNYLYKVIVLCNRSLARIEEHKTMLTTAQQEQWTSEVRAIRAMYYYYLMDMFGRVPLVLDENTPLSSVKQSTRSEVCRFVISELQTALPYLPNEHSNYEGDYYGRLTRPVAWFLLAKIALNAEIYLDDDWTDSKQLDGRQLTFSVNGQNLNAWETCLNYCRLLAAEYRLEESYQTNFAVHNENSQENIFTIPMDKNLYANQFQYLFRSRHYNHGGAIGMDAENGTSATLSTVHTYAYGTDSVDSRYALNFYSDTLRVDGGIVYLDNGQPLVYMPLEVRLDLTGSKYEKTAGARMSKYEIDRTAHSDGKLQDNDIVLYRFADVVLMMSEALWRNGQDGSSQLNLVRQRVGMGKRTVTADNLLAERLMELQWEGWRRQDLVRFRRFHKAYDQRPQLAKEGNAYTTVFPIPDGALDLNHNLTQNPGY